MTKYISNGTLTTPKHKKTNILLTFKFLVKKPHHRYNVYYLRQDSPLAYSYEVYYNFIQI